MVINNSNDDNNNNNNNNKSNLGCKNEVSTPPTTITTVHQLTPSI